MYKKTQHVQKSTTSKKIHVQKKYNMYNSSHHRRTLIFHLCNVEICNILETDMVMKPPPHPYRALNHRVSLLIFKNANKSTGIVTNTRITDASPAGTYAHIADRNWQYQATSSCVDIARQLVENCPGKHIKVRPVTSGLRHGVD